MVECSREQQSPQPVVQRFAVEREPPDGRTFYLYCRSESEAVERATAEIGTVWTDATHVQIRPVSVRLADERDRAATWEGSVVPGARS